MWSFRWCSGLVLRAQASEKEGESGMGAGRCGFLSFDVGVKKRIYSANFKASSERRIMNRHERNETA